MFKFLKKEEIPKDKINEIQHLKSEICKYKEEHQRSV